MAASNFAPLGGRVEIISGYNIIQKFPLPTTARRIFHGAPLWTNGASGVEPCSMYAGNDTSVDHANEHMITTGIVGLAAEERVMQQLSTAQARAYAAGPSTLNPLYASDASAPFISVYTRGIARFPCAAVATQREIGDFIQCAGFVNEGASGFYDPSGSLVADTNYYMYMNLFQYAVTQTAACGWARLVERALVGALYFIAEFNFSRV
jgi:hypothetical protein